MRSTTFAHSTVAGAMQVASVLAFLASMFLSVLPGWPGFGVLLMGWMEIPAVVEVGPFVAFSWLANPLLALVWVLFYLKLYRIASVIGALAFVFGLGCLLGSKVVANEAGIVGSLELGPGYFAWVISIATAFIGAVLGRDKSSVDPLRGAATKGQK